MALLHRQEASRGWGQSGDDAREMPSCWSNAALDGALPPRSLSHCAAMKMPHFQVQSHVSPGPHPADEGHRTGWSSQFPHALEKAKNSQLQPCTERCRLPRRQEGCTRVPTSPGNAAHPELMPRDPALSPRRAPRQTENIVGSLTRLQFLLLIQLQTPKWTLV